MALGHVIPGQNKGARTAAEIRDTEREWYLCGKQSREEARGYNQEFKSQDKKSV